MGDRRVAGIGAGLDAMAFERHLVPDRPRTEFAEHPVPDGMPVSLRQRRGRA